MHPLTGLGFNVLLTIAIWKKKDFSLFQGHKILLKIIFIFKLFGIALLEKLAIVTGQIFLKQNRQQTLENGFTATKLLLRGLTGRKMNQMIMVKVNLMLKQTLMNFGMMSPKKPFVISCVFITYQREPKKLALGLPIIQIKNYSYWRYKLASVYFYCFIQTCRNI